MTYSYQEVIEKISGARRFGNLPGVEVTKRALSALGHPEAGLPFVHVAGTNGKGSTCAFLSSILQCAGKKVGCFTSPHLISFEERITINGNKIPKEDVTRIGNRLLGADFGITMTMFDYCLLMAVLYFKEKGCEIAVIETGLGGRLDSTNALGTPEVSVITRIGLEHTEILGDTLEKIAVEKAGILKKGSEFVMETQPAQIEQVLLEEAGQRGVHSVHKVTQTLLEKVARIPRQMEGAFQNENAAAAMLAASCVLEKDSAFRKPRKIEEICKKGIAQARWPGRMQVVKEKPFLMVDGAHNGCGVAALAESLKKKYPGEKFHFIMGVMADKDYENMVRQLRSIALDFVTVTPESNRALQAKDLAEKIQKEGIPATYCNSIRRIFPHLKQEEKTIAFGSLYFVGELLSLL